MNEVAIRAKLQQFLEDRHRDDDAVFIHELQIDNANRRADLVMANGYLSGFEIKSELDNLDRLPGQLEVYSRLFEQVCVVSASKHIDNILKIIPSGVGLWEVSNDGFKQLISPIINYDLTNVSWASHLTVRDIRCLLKMHGMKTAGLRTELLLKVENIPASNIRDFTLKKLKSKFPDLLRKREKKLKEKKENVLVPETYQTQEHRKVRRHAGWIMKLRHHRQKLSIKLGALYEYLP